MQLADIIFIANLLFSELFDFALKCMFNLDLLAGKSNFIFGIGLLVANENSIFTWAGLKSPLEVKEFSLFEG